MVDVYRSIWKNGRKRIAVRIQNDIDRYSHLLQNAVPTESAFNSLVDRPTHVTITDEIIAEAKDTGIERKRKTSVKAQALSGDAVTYLLLHALCTKGYTETRQRHCGILFAVVLIYTRCKGRI